jgi:hypothetical protein
VGPRPVNSRAVRSGQAALHDTYATLAPQRVQMLHASGHSRRIHRRFIAHCYRGGCPAVGLSHCTASPNLLEAVKRRQACYKWVVAGITTLPTQGRAGVGFHRGRAPDLQIFVTSPAGGRFLAGELTR